MRPITIVAVLFAGAILTLFAAACGGGAYSGGAAATKAVAPTPGAGGGPTAIDVDAADFFFDPTAFTVATGEDVTVTLNNAGASSHTLTVYRDAEFTEPIQGADTGSVRAGSKDSFTASFGAGTYHFRCEFHPTQMQGEFEAE